MKNYLLSSRWARCLKMPRQLVNRKEEGKRIVQISGAVTMINESNYLVRSISGNNTYTVIATKSGWVCSCPDHASRGVMCKPSICS